MEDDTVDAGRFGPWVRGMQAAMRGAAESDVPCGSCTACCRSAQFIHVEPDETRALAAIPAELLFPAPGRPRGHLVMGFDERGHCPMLVDDRCSIYADRPRTCRVYDCRIFPAAGLDAADDGKHLVAERARRWRFRHEDDDDRARHDAVRSAAVLLGADGSGPPSATQTAAAAVEIHDAFLVPGPDAPAAG